MKKVVCKKCGSTDVSVTIAVNPNDITPIAEFFNRNENLDESDWCNQCNDNTDLTFTADEEASDPLLCEECGSTDIQQKIWVDTNTGEIVDWENAGKGECYCQNCEANTRQIRQSELLRTIHKWWGNTDFRQMERITRYRQLDFDPTDGCQTFVDTCDKWWNELSPDIYDDNAWHRYFDVDGTENREWGGKMHSYPVRCVKTK